VGVFWVQRRVVRRGVCVWWVPLLASFGVFYLVGKFFCAGVVGFYFLLVGLWVWVGVF